MKSKHIASQFGIDQTKFDAFLQATHPNDIGMGLNGANIRDTLDASALVEEFKHYNAERERLAAEEETRRIEAETNKRNALSNILITSGFHFEGYHITKYSGYISGDDAIEVERGFAGLGGEANVCDELMKSLTLIRRNALAELKEAAYALGCNAVIGVDFDYITLEPETATLVGGTAYLPYVFGVTANGNAVVIEKDQI